MPYRRKIRSKLTKKQTELSEYKTSEKLYTKLTTKIFKPTDMKLDNCQNNTGGHKIAKMK